MYIAVAGRMGATWPHPFSDDLPAYVYQDYEMVMICEGAAMARKAKK